MDKKVKWREVEYFGEKYLMFSNGRFIPLNNDQDIPKELLHSIEDSYMDDQKEDQPKYEGVLYNPKEGTYSAELFFNGESYSASGLKTEEFAAKIYDKLVFDVGMFPVNFPKVEYTDFRYHITMTHSSFQGVTYNSNIKRYAANLKGLFLGDFKTDEEAAKAVDMKLIEIGREPANLPEHDYQPDIENRRAEAKIWSTSELLYNPKREVVTALKPKEKKVTVKQVKEPKPKVTKDRKVNPKKLSQYKGVSYYKSNRRYISQAKVDKKNLYLGAYPTEEQAAKSYDLYLISTGKAPVNFPTFDYTNYTEVRKQIAKPLSKYKGVSFHKPTQKFLARVFINGKQKTIGNYKTEEEAAKTYDNHLISIGKPPVNFPSDNSTTVNFPSDNGNK